METIATFELVRWAYEQLRTKGRPSADKIIDLIGGGSKSTVLGHMRTIAEEEAKAAGAPDIPLELLTRTATAMAGKLWTQATTMADAAYAGKFETLLTVQNGLFEELKTAAVKEEALEEQLRIAKVRISQLEGQLVERANADQHLAEISRMLRSKAAPQHTPIIQFLRLIESGRPRNREDVFARMIELGHTIKQARTARHHALKEEYAKETPVAKGGAKIAITELGRGKLPDATRAA